MVIFDALAVGAFRQNGWRSLVAIAGVALGVALWLAMRLAGDHAISAFAAQTGVFGDDADFRVERPGGTLDTRLLLRIRGLASIASASPESDGALVVDAKPAVVDADRVLHVEAFDLLAPLPAAFEFRRELPGVFEPAGSGPAPGLLVDDEGIIVSPRFADRFGLRAGGTLHGRIGPRIVALPVAAILPRDVASLDANVAIVDIATAQALFGTRDFDRIACTSVSGSGARAEAAVRALLPAGAVVVAAGERRAEVERMLAGFSDALRAFGLLSLGVASVLVYDALSISVARRRSEVATIRALGASRRAVASAFVAEGAVLGVVGSLIGVATGTVLAAASGAIADTNDPWAADRAAPLIAFGLGILVATIASWFPARRAARLRPAATWSERRFVGSAPPAERVRLGSALLFAAVALGCVGFAGTDTAWLGIFAIAGLTAAAACALPSAVARAIAALRRVSGAASPGVALGLAFLGSVPGRIVVSVGTLGAGVALAAAVLTFGASFLTSLTLWSATAFPGDLAIRPLEGAAASPQARFTPALARRIASLPGVASVSGSRTVVASVGGLPANVTWRTDETRAGATVDAAFAARAHVRAGDVLALPLGRSVLHIRVGSVVAGDPLAPSSLEIGGAAFRLATGDPTLDTLTIRATPAANLERLRSHAARTLAPRLLDIRSARDLRAELIARFDGAVRAVGGVVALAIVAGAGSTATTLFALVLEFRGEIRLLRLTGLRRRGVGLMVCSQAAVVGALAASSGILFGVAVAGMLLAVGRASYGWIMPLKIPVLLLSLLLLTTIGLASLAAIVPARGAALLPVGRVLRMPLGLLVLAAFLGIVPSASSAMPSLTTRVAVRDTRETWRVLGHLSSARGERYDVALTFFRSALRDSRSERSGARGTWAAVAFVAANVAIVDEARRTVATATRVEREGIGSTGSPAAGIDLRLGDWQVRPATGRGRTIGSAPAMKLHVTSANVRAEVTLVPTQPRIALGSDGNVRTGSCAVCIARAVAFPRLRAWGTLVVGGRLVPVSGAFWIDRESARAVLAPSERGWQRFTIQFDDGRALIVHETRDETGTVTVANGTFVDAAGRAHALGPRDIVLENPLATAWRNDRGRAYPSLYRLAIQRYDLDLALVPDVQAQEVDPGLHGPRIYLGALDVERAGAGPRDMGHGYVELTGYDAALRL